MVLGYCCTAGAVDWRIFFDDPFRIPYLPYCIGGHLSPTLSAINHPPHRDEMLLLTIGEYFDRIFRPSRRKATALGALEVRELVARNRAVSQGGWIIPV